MDYYCDNSRHLVCIPYNAENLHLMAKDLDIKRCWYHGGKFPHYDIPKEKINQITNKCKIVSSQEILRIIKGKNMIKKFIIEKKNKDTNSVIPSKLIYHSSNPFFRESILKNGLIPKHGEGWLDDDNIGGDAIFAVDDISGAVNGSKMEIDTDLGTIRKYDSGYDDDVWTIDTTKCDNIWYVDKNVHGGSKEFIYTRTKIPNDSIKLIYKGNGLSYD